MDPAGKPPASHAALSQSATAKALLLQCREIARKRLSSILAESLKQVEDDLFRCADRSRSGAEQQGFLDAMMHVRQYRQVITQAFERHFIEVFDRRLNARPVDNLSITQQLSADALSLMDKGALDEQLAVSELARTTTNSLDPDQSLGIRARFGHLLSEGLLDDRRNPLSAEAVFEALRLACSKIPGDFAVKRSLLNAFQPYVARGIDSVYADVNQSLIQHEVLPKIKHTVERTAATGRHRVVTDPTWASLTQPMAVTQSMRTQGLVDTAGVSGFGGTGGGAGTSVGSGGAPALAGGSGPSSAAAVDQAVQGHVDLTQALANALASPPAVRRVVAKMLAEPTRYDFQRAIETPASPELVTSLTSLQAVPVFGQPRTDYLLSIDEAVRAQSHPLDLLTVEFVAVVFEHILGDAAIPETVKAHIARLQIVAVKAAILDRTFFARREHPMRHLLDRIASAAIDPEIETGAESGFIKGLRSIVNDIVANFKDDLAVFPEAEARLEAIIRQVARSQSQEFRSEASELEQKERAEIAHTTAIAEVRRRVNRSTPKFVQSFLAHWWSKALAQSYLKDLQGDDSWTHRLGVVDALVWTVGPLARAEVSQLATMLPMLMRNLMRGMTAIDMAPDARQSFFNELMATHTKAIESMKAVAKSQPIQVFAPDVPDEDGVPYVTELAAPPHSEPPADYFEHAVMALERGTVVEFVDGDSVVRSKLSWISPKQTIYLFTSSAASARQFAPRNLAEALRAGQARILDASEALMDRIVRTVVGEAIPT
jgi:hypothetical protein